jgi:hypothetical protein
MNEVECKSLNRDKYFSTGTSHQEWTMKGTALKGKNPEQHVAYL